MSKHPRLGKISKTILLTLGITAGLTVAVIAPNLVQLIPVAEKIFGKSSYDNNYNRASRISELIKMGRVKVVTKDGRHILELTKSGQKALGRARLMKAKPCKWDGKWRLVSFDVWEKSRGKRDLLRNELREFGFVQLQKSLWIYPHSCEDFIILLRTDMHFGKNIRYIVAEKIEGDISFRKHFNI